MRENLPLGWTIAQLEQLVTADGLMTDGDWVESKDQDPEGNVRLLQLADIGAGEFRDRSNRFLTSAKATELNCTYLKPGDVLIARLGDVLGKACLAPQLPQPAVTVVDVHVFRAGHADVSHRWLMHLLNAQGTQRALEQISSGTTRKRVTGQKLKELEVLVPPAREQGRIASRIDELFSEIDEGERALERVQRLVERYRQSVLKAAVTGELTAGDRESGRFAGESGGALLQRVLERRFAPAAAAGRGGMPVEVAAAALPALPANWAWASLDQLCGQIGNGLSRKPAHEPPGTPILRISAVRPLAVDAGDLRYYQAEHGERLDGYFVKTGDLLFTRYNGSRELVGVSGVYRGSESVLHPDKLIKARVVSSDLVLPDYLAIALNAGETWKFLTSCVKTSAGQHGIAGADIKRAPIPLPPAEEQRRIVEAWQQFEAQMAVLKTSVPVEVRRGRALRQSVLKAAFSGQLVPQDAADEPASALLARLAAQAGEAQNTTQRRGRRARTTATP